MMVEAGFKGESKLILGRESNSLVAFVIDVVVCVVDRVVDGAVVGLGYCVSGQTICLGSHSQLN